MLKPITALFLLLFSLTASAQKNNNDPVSEPALSSLIDSLYAVDQQVQQDAIAVFQRTGSLDSFKVYEQLKSATFARHITLLKGIAAIHGYPNYEKVGKQSANNFFTLVQHADADLAFQLEMLPLIKKQVDKRQVSGSNYAFLYDRVQVNTGKQQLYGTQLDYMDGRAIAKDLKDKKGVNKRRKAMGMETLENYLSRATEMHRQMNKRN